MSRKLYIKESILRNLIRKTLCEIKAFHGSGARFNKFDSSFNGSGEGSSCFGPGHYFTSSKRIGKDYAMEHGTSQCEVPKITYKGSNGDYYYQGHSIYNKLNDILHIEDYDASNGDYLWQNIPKLIKTCNTKQEFIHQIYQYLITAVKHKEDYQEDPDWYQYKLNKALQFLNNELEENQRSLYQVEIPDGKYALWSDNVPEDMIKYASELIAASNSGRAKGRWSQFLNDRKILTREGMKTKEIEFEDFYYRLNNLEYEGTFGDNIFKYTLKRFGYVGVTYPSGMNYKTSSTKEGDMNYTVFDDNNVKVTNRWDY